MEKTIFQMILSAQNEQKAMCDLLMKFEPILNKYAGMLNYEDAYYDLAALFIEKILSLDCKKLKANDDFTLLKYIKKIVTSIFSDLFKKQVYLSKLNTVELPSENGLCYNGKNDKEDGTLWCEDDYPVILEDLLTNVLTDYQAKIINYVVVKGYPVSYVAKVYGVTPEAITISKNRALKKLKKYFSLDI